jgi:hypothetical protein
MPAGVTTLGAVRTAAQLRADMANSQFLTTAEWNANIQSSYQELYDLLVQKYGDNYYVTTTFSITTDGINERFALPVDFYKLLGASLVVTTSSPTQYLTLRPFMFGERDALSVPGMAIRGRTSLRYRIDGNNLWLRPFPMGGHVIQLYYIPRLVVPVLDADTIDGVNGWEEYIVVDAAIKAMQKEESDCSLLVMQKQALEKRIEAAAENRDAGMPARVVDVRRDGDYGAGGYGWGYGGDW